MCPNGSLERIQKTAEKIIQIKKRNTKKRGDEIEVKQVCPNGSLDREGIEELYAMPRR